MDHLHALDAEFLDVEDGVNHMHIGLCATFDGPCPSEREARVLVAAALPAIPRYRQHLRHVPLGLARPTWEDAADFDLTEHVSCTRVPAPGGDRELEALVAELMSTELDRRRPLWELWVVDGLAEGRWAMIGKVHHCLVDGVAGMALMEVLLDHEPTPALPVEDPWAPERPASDTRLAVDGLGQLLRPLVAAPVWLASRVTHLPSTFRAAGDLAHGVGAWLHVVRPSTRTSMGGDVGPGRHWCVARASLADAKAIRAERGGTVNDVVLAAVTNGFRSLLLARGEDPRGVELRTAVPVSVRHDDAALDNEVTSIVVDLPVGIGAPELRYEVVRCETDQAKRSHEAEAGEALSAAADWLPAPLLAAGTRMATAVLHRVPQRGVNTVTTNVPGPPFPLYAAGRRMVELFPYVPVGLGVRVTVAITSYDGGLYFGVTGDEASTPDLAVVAKGIEAGIAQLLRR